MAELAETMDQATKAMTDGEGKYLTFALAKEEYGIGILKVKEIIGLMSVTAVPQTPGFVKGVINLRGKVIPVVDLRLKFGMQEIEYTERTCIIVVEIVGYAGDTQIGIVVDAVSEVLNIKGEDIEETPTFGAKLDTDYILGMAKIEGGVKILLDIDKVLSRQEFEVVSAVKKEDPPLPAEATPEQTPAEATPEQTPAEATPEQTPAEATPEEAVV
ncbi:MAG: chemotaxis protein CheW [Desulfobacterales bacterium]|nr:chemotaxis protein CheW [Desulfobacterales bacterium]